MENCYAVKISKVIEKIILIMNCPDGETAVNFVEEIEQEGLISELHVKEKNVSLHQSEYFKNGVVQNEQDLYLFDAFTYFE